MGDISEAILDGVMCEHCGAWIEDNVERFGVEVPGFPVACPGCREDHGEGGSYGE